MTAKLTSVADLNLLELPIGDRAFGEKPDPQVVGEPRWRRFPGVLGPETLPIRFTLA